MEEGGWDHWGDEELGLVIFEIRKEGLGIWMSDLSAVCCLTSSGEVLQC